MIFVKRVFQVKQLKSLSQICDMPCMFCGCAADSFQCIDIDLFFFVPEVGGAYIQS